MSYVGYIKSTENQADYQSQHEVILTYARENNLDLACVYSDSSFDNVKNVVASEYDGFIVGNIASLGSSLPAIRDNLYSFKENGLALHSIAEGYKLTPKILTKDKLAGIDLAISIRYNMTSVVTKAALANKKAQGFKLGRAGKFNRKHVLSGKEAEVYQLIASGMPKLHIAKHFNITPTTLYNFLKREKKSQGTKENYYA